jgi:hypothetical protein
MGAVGLASVMRADEQAQPNKVLTGLAQTTLAGYVDTSAQWNIGTGNANAPAYIFGGPAKADGFNLNVVKLVLEHDADPADGWGAGYKVDLLFGPDAVTYGTQSTGVGSDFAIKQAYLDLKAPAGNGLEFKMGVWDTILGYEVFETPLNPNFTRSYGYTIEPATFTGILAIYNFTELISAGAGVANTESSVINSRAFYARAESYKTYMGYLSWAAPSTWSWASGSTLYGAIVNGYDPVAAATGFTPADQTCFYVGSTINTPCKQLKVGVAYDYEAVAEQPISRSGYAHALGGYLNYQVNDRCSINGRAEYFSQSPANVTPGLPSKVVALTATFEYDLWVNVLSRVEFRWDHAADGSTPYGGTVPGEGGLRNSEILMLNLIYKF